MIFSANEQSIKKGTQQTLNKIKNKTVYLCSYFPKKRNIKASKAFSIIYKTLALCHEVGLACFNIHQPQVNECNDIEKCYKFYSCTVAILSLLSSFIVCFIFFVRYYFMDYKDNFLKRNTQC